MRRMPRLLLALALALLSWAWGQAGDAFGDGSLIPPTSPRFADPAWYDLVDVVLLDGDSVSVRITMGAVDARAGFALGISQPIIEVYIDDGGAGAEALLPGSGLAMPLGTGWRWALRVTGDGAWGWQADAAGDVTHSEPFALDARLEGNELTLFTPFPRPIEGRLEVYAVSGVYDPFSRDGWRPLTREPSPWAFSSTEQSLPVVDVFPGDADARAAALARGELPRRAPPGVIDRRAQVWLVLMAAGVVLALVGVWVRAVASRLRRAWLRSGSLSTPALAVDPTDLPDAERADDAVGAVPELIQDADGIDWKRLVDATPALPAPSGGATASDAGSSAADDVDADQALALAPSDATVAVADASDGTSDTSAPSDASRPAKPS